MQLNIIVSQGFLAYYGMACMVAMVAGFIATEVSFKRPKKDWSYE